MSENKNSEYSMSEDDFSKPPTEIKDHKDGDSINRDNFASFISKSFALSMGDPGLHYTYFKWLEETTGFKWKETLTNFIKADGWNSLKEEEKTKLKESFANVGKHVGTGDEKNWQNDPKTTLDYQLNGLLISRDNPVFGYLEAKYTTFKKRPTPQSEMDLVPIFKELKTQRNWL